MNEYDFNVIVREVFDEDLGRMYYVAECLELPGCVADGGTAEQAEASIESAIKLCLSVAIEDALTKVTRRKTLPDLRDVVKQDRLRVQVLPELQHA